MDICPCVGATGKRTKEHVLRVQWLEGAPHESDVCAEAFPRSDPRFGSAGASAHWRRSRCSFSLVRVSVSQDAPRGLPVRGDGGR